ncbi:MAG: hypothetical protein F4124_02985 [Acidimicrobiia bacterium]|nr:hypothetical protein [Acidimicrobiia bacterium]MXZ86654.1 hypothetical protein [Acidimicrobiia bacterium]MYB74070.1 hypothetical protein [Acidimicrobiia bacterium]MYG73366.1 hypothetical protein [Acidimicrobiia bacterium]MYH98384.1 hypothetical protein [Acidimicrobiia bacterium]
MGYPRDRRGLRGRQAPFGRGAEPVRGQPLHPHRRHRRRPVLRRGGRIRVPARGGTGRRLQRAGRR